MSKQSYFEPARNKLSYFGPELFKFLGDLEKNNNKAWFEKNKVRYEKDVKEPMLTFIEDFGLFLKSISPNFVVDPSSSGGSMFRIFRDTRFSRDKSPYKTWVAAKFNHRQEGNNVHAPGFYLHLEVNNSMGGGGLWHPDADALAKVRDAIANQPVKWKAVKDKGIKVEGDSLKRPPQGYSLDHPYIEDLKYKDFYAMVSFSQKEVTAPDFMEHYLKACKKVSPLVEFLTKSLGLPW